MSFGAFPHELADLRFTHQKGALIVDLYPKDVYYAPPSSLPSETEKALEGIGAHRVVPGLKFLRLRFPYIDGLAYCGPDETPDLFKRIPDRDSGPMIAGQDWPHPLLKVENSDWAKDMIGGVEHYRMVGPFFTLDVLGYEPDGEWMENPDYVAP